MSKSLIKTPFSDAVGDDAVPHKGNAKGSYDAASVPNTPGRDGGLFPELTFDTHFSGPKRTGPWKKTLFKDAIGK